MVKRSRPPVRHTRHTEEMQARKRQRTTTRQNPFFEQLNYDMRRCIYDYLTLSPFADAKSCAGIYLSCRQCKNEMDQAASVQLRTRLLGYQKSIKKDSNGQVHIQLPKEIESRPVPTETVMDISVTMNAGWQPLEISRWFLTLHEMLFSLNIGRLHIHIDLPFQNRDYHTNITGLQMPWIAIISELLHRLLGPHDHKPVMRVRETMVTWRAIEKTTEKASEENKSPEALIIEGRKFQFASATPDSPYSYCFCHEAVDCGAWVIITPNPFKQGRTISNQELDMLTAYDSHGDQFSLEFSKATMNSMTLEISDGEKATGEDARSGPHQFYFRIEHFVRLMSEL
ncbi:hypothetical protein PTNB73_06565 [Pyrenophora teres f. teres]|uniref:Uncharacterized protein n=1 Tax=Pyrenophora teres f. teres TaxID=97479 RepID=A0A6S6W660_9PLEO|nr:hypothetical protein HRS9139_07327 [Pyrenophora teres f. teres]KAE8829471.1 hypothetical protein HRS9122_09286 [Pyrenophora teres f. teres]KAE8830706.1 hypothetical protein PTNB85_07293 [Pyrenophora teres f. teres]KAE8857294.1 hypothetical protein PTNB29_08361 [Pyrenophora teres f. teres]KAE8863358.1 hypothetical protein PTNB73_06565 [Pyrenophora teres f. teres]